MATFAKLPKILALIIMLLPLVAQAHGFGRLYNLPVPFWLYAWTASAVLIVSFLLAAYFAQASSESSREPGEYPHKATRLHRLRWGLPWLKALSVFLLLLCLVTAFFGNPDPYRNFSMTFFWVVFLLGFTYATAVIGNIYAAINPWRVIAETIGWCSQRYRQGLFTYPKTLGTWPALVLYLGFIWLELFGHGKPLSLGWMLLTYTGINLLGAGLVGITAWFRHCEFFSVYLRLIALMAVVDYAPASSNGERATLQWRKPLVGLIQTRATQWGTVVFVLAMLSTTTFDGLRATLIWVRLFWSDPTGWVTALAGSRPIMDIAALRPWYIAWETLWLVALPLVYLGVYLVFIWLTQRLAGSQRPVRNLAFDFAYTLLPIVLVYHMTHYATLMLTQGLKILSLASDPFGWGWDIFGTAMHFRAPILPGMGLVWHTQVGLILLGHMASVYLSHRVALRVLPSRGRAFLGQLPMLLLMILFTLVGLWVLAQPLTVERMQ